MRGRARGRSRAGGARPRGRVARGTASHLRRQRRLRTDRLSGRRSGQCGRPRQPEPGACGDRTTQISSFPANRRGAGRMRRLSRTGGMAIPDGQQPLVAAPSGGRPKRACLSPNCQDGAAGWPGNASLACRQSAANGGRRRRDDRSRGSAGAFVEAAEDARGTLHLVIDPNALDAGPSVDLVGAGAGQVGWTGEHAALPGGRGQDGVTVVTGSREFRLDRSQRGRGAQGGGAQGGGLGRTAGLACGTGRSAGGCHAVRRAAAPASRAAHV